MMLKRRAFAASSGLSTHQTRSRDAWSLAIDAAAAAGRRAWPGVLAGAGPRRLAWIPKQRIGTCFGVGGSGELEAQRASVPPGDLGVGELCAAHDGAVGAAFESAGDVVGGRS